MNRITYLLSAMSILIVSIAAAKPDAFDPTSPHNPMIVKPPAAGSVGWLYGRANCGPFATPPIASIAKCKACCSSNEIPVGPLNPAETINCMSYCNSAFPVTISPPWWTWWFV